MKCKKYILLFWISLLCISLSAFVSVEANNNPVGQAAEEAAGGSTAIPYCNWEDDEWNPACWLQQWVDTVGEIGGLARVKRDANGNPVLDADGNPVSLWISDFIQDIVAYILTFVSLIAVLYIIWAGFQILVGNWEEEKLKKSKTTILYVVLGIVVIWLAWPITNFVISALS